MQETIGITMDSGETEMKENIRNRFLVNISYANLFQNIKTVEKRDQFINKYAYIWVIKMATV